MDTKSSKYEMGTYKKNKVGPVSELIRECSPKSLKDWEEYYFKNVYSGTI